MGKDNFLFLYFFKGFNLIFLLAIGILLSSIESFFDKRLLSLEEDSNDVAWEFIFDGI